MAECVTVDHDVVGSTPIAHPYNWTLKNARIRHFLFLKINLGERGFFPVLNDFDPFVETPNKYHPNS